MGLSKCKLGEHIELCEAINSNLEFGLDSVRGVSNLKQLMFTKADINARDLSKFQIVYPGEFVYNRRTNRHGNKLCIAYNDGCTPIICTEDYVVFQIKKESKSLLLDEWLFLYFNRPEFDRFVITNSWGSSTEFFRWEDICDVELYLPPLPVQQKYVDIYKAMVANQQSYERGLEDLKLTVDAFLEKYKYSTKRVALGDVIQESDMRNTEGKVVCVHGVNKDKSFMPSVASGEDIKNYKLVKRGSFACNLMHIGRDVVVPIALNTSDETRIVSPAYVVFDIDNTVVLPEFVLMWLSRVETDRRTWFMCDSSVRSGMEKKRFFEITIPQPPLVEQQTLVNLHRTLAQRREINERLKTQIKDICPILIKGSLEEGK